MAWTSTCTSSTCAKDSSRPSHHCFSMNHSTLGDAIHRVRSFTDLRRFAADDSAGLRLHGPGEGDAFLVARRCLFQSRDAEVGAIDLPAGQGGVDGTTADEFVIVCDGGLSLSHGAGTTELRSGASAVLPRGTVFSWRAERPTKLVYMRHASESGHAARVVTIDESAPLQASGAPLAELLIGPTPACRNHTDFRSADGEFTCGTWDSTPYRRKAMLYGHSELMVLLEGSVTLEDETGASHTFNRHDIFVVEQGARCSWDSR